MTRWEQNDSFCFLYQFFNEVGEVTLVYILNYLRKLLLIEWVIIIWINSHWFFNLNRHIRLELRRGLMKINYLILVVFKSLKNFHLEMPTENDIDISVEERSVEVGSGTGIMKGGGGERAGSSARSDRGFYQCVLFGLTQLGYLAITPSMLSTTFFEPSPVYNCHFVLQ